MAAGNYPGKLILLGQRLFVIALKSKTGSSVIFLMTTCSRPHVESTADARQRVPGVFKVFYVIHNRSIQQFFMFYLKKGNN